MAATAARTVLPPIAEERAPLASAAWKWIRRGTVLAIVAAIVLVARARYLQPAVVSVVATRVQLGTVEELVTNNKAGSVRARQQAALSPEIGGRVARLPIEEGDRVHAGDVLLAIADEDLRAQVAMQERSLDAARLAATEACAQADLAAIELDRNRRLLADGYASQQMVDQAQNERTTAEASCAAARARVEESTAAVTLAQVSLGKAVLRAPFDAIVSKVSTHLGEWITPSPAGLPMPTAVELIDPASIYVRAPLDEVDAGRVRAGLPARITLDAYPGRAFAARVTRVGSYVSEVEQQNRTFDVDLALADRAFARTLLPGTSADVEIVLRTREGVLRIPTSAILQGGSVLVVRNGVLVSQPVHAGLSNWEFTEVVDGLRAGDAVVTSLDRPEVKAGARASVELEGSR